MSDGEPSSTKQDFPCAARVPGRGTFFIMSYNFNLSNCTLCPRNCGVNREAGQTGFCRVPAQLIAARAGLLAYEEPCLVGSKGSGAVFFSGCNLGCIFCQNHEISGTDRKELPPGKQITASASRRFFWSFRRRVQPISTWSHRHITCTGSSLRLKKRAQRACPSPSSITQVLTRRRKCSVCSRDSSTSICRI